MCVSRTKGSKTEDVPVEHTILAVDPVECEICCKNAECTKRVHPGFHIVDEGTACKRRECNHHNGRNHSEPSADDSTGQKQKDAIRNDRREMIGVAVVAQNEIQDLGEEIVERRVYILSSGETHSEEVHFYQLDGIAFVSPEGIVENANEVHPK